MRKIEPKEGVEIFVNTKCNITLKQNSFEGIEQIIVIHKEDIPLFIKHLEEVHKEALECEPDTEDEE